VVIRYPILSNELSLCLIPFNYIFLWLTSRQPSNAGGSRRLAFTEPANDKGKVKNDLGYKDTNWEQRAFYGLIAELAPVPSRSHTGHYKTKIET